MAAGGEPASEIHFSKETPRVTPSANLQCLAHGRGASEKFFEKVVRLASASATLMMC